jgi:hypothetical protein
MSWQSLLGNQQGSKDRKGCILDIMIKAVGSIAGSLAPIVPTSPPAGVPAPRSLPNCSLDGSDF